MANRGFSFRRRLLWWAVLLPACVLVAVSHPGPSVQGQEARSAAPHPAHTPDPAGYLGSAVCADCHAEIYRSYRKTPMGRSIVPADADAISRLAVPATFTNPSIDRDFAVFVKGGTLYQSESAHAADGTAIFETTHDVRWLIGAGVNGYGPVVERNSFLFQAPLSYYTKPMAWAPSPGYEALDLGFNRPILPGCITCHAGRANYVAGTNGRYTEPVFAEPAIGCENCHGPGAAHVQAMLTTHNAGRATLIVNPKRLTPYMADNICMQCHQMGDARVLQPGKSYADIRPGRPLDDILAIVMIPPTRETPPDADHTQHYYAMTLSRCFRASGGRMSCLSCHDPHTQPSPAEAPAYYRQRCLTCHTNQSCRLPLAQRMAQQPANDCIRCHMPKRDIQTISHSTATNHRILARPDEPFPEAAFDHKGQPIPDLLHLDPAPGKEHEPLPLLTQLQVYGALAADHPQYVDRYLAVLKQLEVSDAQNAVVQAAAGRRDLKAGDLPSAIAHLTRATALAPPEATTCADLAEALARSGHGEDALQWLDRAIALDPYNPFTQRNRVLLLLQLHDYARVRGALTTYVETFPQDNYMRQMLAKVPPQ